MKLITTIYNLLWGDLVTIPLPGGGSLGRGPFFHGSLQHFGEETHRKKAGARRKKDPGGDQQKYQERQTQRAAAGQRDRNQIAP